MFVCKFRDRSKPNRGVIDPLTPPTEEIVGKETKLFLLTVSFDDDEQFTTSAFLGGGGRDELNDEDTTSFRIDDETKVSERTRVCMLEVVLFVVEVRGCFTLLRRNR